MTLESVRFTTYYNGRDAIKDGSHIWREGKPLIVIRVTLIAEEHRQVVEARVPTRNEAKRFERVQPPLYDARDLRDRIIAGTADASEWGRVAKHLQRTFAW